MKELEINRYEVTRFTAKMRLETFTFDLYDSFEPSANKQIKKLLDEKKKSKEKYNDLGKRQNKDTTGKKSIELEQKKYYYFIEEEYLNEELWSLVEMKIIYAFKYFEINIKKLIRTSFSGTKTRDLFRWNSLINFLQSKNIKPEKLRGFLEIEQLKDVNNTLKHSDTFSEEMRKKIPEFNTQNDITYSDLNTFYERVKTFPKIYLGALANAIYSELYEFNERKIDKIANNIAYRLEERDADLLIKALKSKY